MDPTPKHFHLAHRPFDSLAPAVDQSGSRDAVVIAIEKNLYRDNSRVTPEEVEAEIQSKRVAVRRKKEPTFPMKLHRLLSDPDAEGAITWLPHGRAWKILSQEKFETSILPRHFDHGNLASFRRQVNGWDFRRVEKGADENGYYHELFLRGMPHLCLKMTRTKRAKSGVAGVLCPPKLLSITPDFYRISRDHPLPDEADSAVSSTQDTNTSDTAEGATEVLSSMQESTNKTPDEEPVRQPDPAYSNLATEALQRYITQDFVEAQRTMSNIQVFQQRLQARQELVENLRTIMNVSSGASVPISTTFVPRGLGGPNIASDTALLLLERIARANQQS